ncbi:adenosylcobyric acid synthase (glutamine-hydrolysing) [Desulfotomaculum arcticum]|uniref:Cobyric acid synthase n=1 Tax=Desulfotruncus arcticus DSM 17038 TaxID=1121424 RepID=A0A1I2S7D1_9FIRM|nr:cobyric acid synthase [Desulfotruncus arcticus]SFG48233.1 adenosylcobyric acid synthase (glutamine-hydrolysing) [Desulfotomaculum arcticum] [Desulfotruncus arcticus DSM 17038]
MLAHTIMVQGTASHAGKSILVAALCRIFYQDGFKVAPFKSQNMALNSYVTAHGGEMGRAQVVQAEAAGIAPEVNMNPILLKPTGNSSSQVIVLGRPLDNYSAQSYHSKVASGLWEVVTKALAQLRREYNVVVIEGAGSPAEVNLDDTEIVNMRVAREADAPVLLVADIDRGGALAAVVGTLELLRTDDRERVKGIIINKFRGDVGIFQPAIDFLEQKTGIPVLGVIPFFTDLRIQDEDSVVMEEKKYRAGGDDNKIQICVIRLPRLSNFTDFDPFETDVDVELRYVRRVNELGRPDLVIIPGSKNTIEDLLYLKETGLAGEIVRAAKSGTPVVGICGGFQMLGSELLDPEKTESNIAQLSGLGLLEMKTVFAKDKVTSQVTAVINGGGEYLNGYAGELTGYEIHMGRTELGETLGHAFNIQTRSGLQVAVKDGAVSQNGNVWGTYMHGIFDNDGFRRHLIQVLKQKKGIIEEQSSQVISTLERRQRDYDRLADHVRSNLNMKLVYSILGI